MSYSIERKTAIVTGAANGIGLAIARHFAAQGAKVVFADMDESRLDAEIGAEARKEENIRMFAGDLRQRLTVANLLSATIDAFDQIDILVNASRQCAPCDPLAQDDDTVERMLQQNMLTGLRISQAVAKRMIAQAEAQQDERPVVGSIVNLSSIAAQRTRPELMAYSIAMAASDQMTRTLALALAPHKIRVNSIGFGSVMSASLKEQIREHPELRTAIRENTPLGRIASPSEVAQAAQFLASDAAAFMTGQILTLDGGRTLVDPVAAPVH